MSDATDLQLRAGRRALRQAVDSGTRPPRDLTGNAVVDALLACADSLGIEVADERIATARRRRLADVGQAARVLGLTVRPVDLADGPGWWSSDADAMVALADGEWVALVPERGHRVQVTGDGTRTRIDRRSAAAVDPAAFSVTPVLPDRKSGPLDVVRIAWSSGSVRDVWVIVLCAVVAALLATVAPILSGQIVAQYVPTGETGRIVSVAIVLVVVSLIATVVGVVQGLVAQRLAARSDLRASAALYDRLFRLPLSFHRRHEPGELAQRVAGFSAVRDALALALPILIASVSALVASLLVLFTRMTSIAVLVLLVAVAFLGVGAVLLRIQYRDSRELTKESLELSGSVFAMLGGIAKIRVAGAQDRLYARWLLRYARQQRAARAVEGTGIRMGLLTAIPAAVVSLMVVLVAAQTSPPLGLGEFTTISAAAAQAAGAVTLLLPVAAIIVGLVPTVGAIGPILKEAPEGGSGGAEDPGRLAGDVALHGVGFSYEEGAPVLTDVSVDIPAGSMTALVGPSGSGKSTVVRLLLGLEEPESGQILYDGRALAQLDKTAVRRQLGVVPQDAALATGSLLENIAGGSPLVSEADAWVAAEQAGLADDIRAMPMGMQTVVSDGAGTFSGGQRQRVMLARALARNPQIVVLDEATSALDNTAQAKVAESLEALGSTRIVVAHRLSTIRNADQIVVLVAGRVAQTGTYDELMAVDGPFRDLAARQTTD